MDATGKYGVQRRFQLREWKSNDRVIVARNPRYWEAQSVVVEEVVFLPVVSGTTNVNLYKAGAMQSMDPRLIPPVLLPALRKNKDFGTSPALRTLWYALNVTKPPLDRLLVRYALNLSTDKDAIASFWERGRTGERNSPARWRATVRCQRCPF